MSQIKTKCVLSYLLSLENLNCSREALPSPDSFDLKDITGWKQLDTLAASYFLAA